MSDKKTKEISVFVDESGSYDPSLVSSRYYMVCFVFHDQAIDISDDLAKLNTAIALTNIAAGHCIHTSPLIRRENEYSHEPRETRKAVFFKLLSFARKAPVSYKSFLVDKRFTDSPASIHVQLSRAISTFLREQAAVFAAYDALKIYYDNGQPQVKKILQEAFSQLPAHIDFIPEVTPSKYRLFQVADLICTLELINARIKAGLGLNNSEKSFFGNARLFKRNILSQLTSKEWR